MKRPPWEAYVIEGLGDIEGLPEGAFAILLKIHHAAIDGISAAETILAIHNEEPVLSEPPLNDPWQPDPVPNRTRMAARGYLRNLTRPARLVGQVGDLVSALREQDAEHDENERRDSRSRTRFNARVSPHRVCDGVRLDLAGIKAIKNAVPGATVNDVVLTTVGGALRRYLDEKGELPEASLGAGAPVNVRTADQLGTGGNQISAMTLTLRTDIADPVERLEAIHVDSQRAKSGHSALGDNTFTSITENVSTWLASMSSGALSAVTWLQEMPMPVHTVVSNVPGPQQPLYMSGARLETVMGLGPLLDNMGLFHAVMSVAGELTITFCACRTMLPDPEHYRVYLQDSFDELKAATLKPKKKARKRSKRSK